MWFSLFSFALLLSIAFFQAIQGLFSAVIMCMLTVLSAALAFGVYEQIYHSALLTSMPDNGEAIALVGVFIIALGILRTVSDNVIKGNMVFPLWVDRIGGGVFGFLAAMIIVGMIQIGFQMLQFDSTFLGFNRFVACAGNRELDETTIKKKSPEDVSWKRQELWLSPDRFTAELIGTLSGGALSGTTRFREVHPDFTAGLQNSRAGAQRESHRAVPGVADGIEVDKAGYWLLPAGRLLRPKVEQDRAGNDVLKDVPAEGPAGDREWRVYRIFLTETARDSDGKIRFRPPQVRIVGLDAAGRPAEYTLKGIQREGKDKKLRFVELFREPVIGKEETSTVFAGSPRPKEPFDLVFEVPKGFRARFIEYKRTARVDVSMLKAKSEGEITGGRDGGTTERGSRPRAEQPSSPDAESQQGPEASAEAPNRIHGVWIGGRPTFRDRLPIKLAGNVAGADIQNGKLVGGHFQVAITEANQTDNEAERLPIDIPSGEQMLFVPVKELDPQSYLGQARGFAQRALPTVSLALSNGREIKPAGKYAFAKIGGQWWFEIHLLDPTARTAEADVPIFDKIKHANLVEPDSVYVYLFAVPSGVQATQLIRKGAEPIDLKRYNLVAR